MFSWSSLTDFTSKVEQTFADLGEKISDQANAALENVTESATEVASDTINNVSAFVTEAQTTLQQTNTSQQIEQMKRQKLERQLDDGCSPWEYKVDSEDYDEQIAQELETRIRQLSEDTNTFLMEAPSSSSVFEFDMDAALPYALNTLKIDSKLNALRFKLVPARILEEQFWKNYFYRVQVLRESLGVPRLPLTNAEVFGEEQSVTIEMTESTDVDSDSKVNEDATIPQSLPVARGHSSTDDEPGDERKSSTTNESAPSTASWVDVQERSGMSGVDEVMEEVEDDYLVSDDVNIENLSPEARAKMQAELGLGATDDVDLEDLDAMLGDAGDIPDITDAELERELSGNLP